MMMNRTIRTMALLLLGGAASLCSGCFLFSGNDEKDKDKGSMTSAMDPGGSNNVDAVRSTPTSPWQSIELRDEGGSSLGWVPVVAIILSLLSLGGMITHWLLLHRHGSSPHV